MSEFALDPNGYPICLNYNRTVIAQYANSPTILGIIGSFSEAMKLCPFFNDFYKNIWNIDTANGHGLDIWGVIVGVNRTVKTFNGYFWGFQEETLLIARPYHDENGESTAPDTAYYTNMGMFRDEQELMGEITFNDTNFRKLIFAKAYANISDQTTQNLNYILMFLFGQDGHEVYIQDNLDMSMTFVFNWFPSADEGAIIVNTGILSKPAGVEIKIKINV